MLAQRLIEAYYPRGELETATPARRLAGYLLDGVLAFLTLGIGWLVWSVFVWQRGQSPAKQLLSMYVMREDGSRAGGWYTFLREVIIRGFVVPAISLITLGVFGVLASIWCVWDRERQCLWDKIIGSYVAYSPEGYRPLTAGEYRERGEAPPGRRVRGVSSAVE